MGLARRAAAGQGQAFARHYRPEGGRPPAESAVLDGYRGTLPVRCALRLAPLVFVRPGELCTAEWADIDLEGAEWRYTVTKTDTPHIVPLSRQAVEVLRELYPLTGQGGYVFPNARYPRRERPMSANTLWRALRALDVRPDQMTMHGFRAMARTILDEVVQAGADRNAIAAD